MDEDKISEKTVVPLGFLLLLAGAAVGAILWLADIHSTASHARDRIVELSADTRAERESLRDINQRLSRIEGMLEKIQDSKK